MEFKALHVHALTEEVAKNLESVLSSLSGIEQFKITLETQELQIVFDENQIRFQTLAQKMAQAGCSLKDIDAALLL
jgi:hypothetical protein